MKNLKFNLFLLVIIVFGILLGFSFYDIKPKLGSKMFDVPLKSISPDTKTPSIENTSDGIPPQLQNDGIIYSDNFNTANDTTSLKARGYKVYYRGTGPQDAETWFTGTNPPFPAFNGPATGYVAANYQVVTGLNNIDSWLVLPPLNLGADDSLWFYSRSPTADPFPDSIWVMYSPTGDSTPEGTSWALLGRFKTNTAGVWELRGFDPTAAGTTARYAIRYHVFPGGPSSINSDWIGIDALTVGAQPPPPPVDIVSVSNVYAMGKKPKVCLDTNTISVRISHLRAQQDTLFVNWKIKNLNGFVKNNFNDIIIISGVRDTVYSHNYIKTDSIKTDSIIVTATANGETSTDNNRATYVTETTLNAWNYAITTDPVDGGVGFNGGTGDFVAKFYTNCVQPICAVDLSFFAPLAGGSQPYNVVIYAANGAGGIPGTTLYRSVPLTSPVGTGLATRVTHILPSAVNVGPGGFYVGVLQSGIINLSYSFQNEIPIRSQSFFYRAPDSITGVWTDFSPGANFRLDICPRTYLSIKLTTYLEGEFNGSTNTPDTIRLDVRSQSNPNVIIETATGIMNSAGEATYNFCNVNDDTCYYFVTHQRNHLETWTHSTCEKLNGCPKLYNMTTSISQSFVTMTCPPAMRSFSYFPIICPPQGPAPYVIWGGDITDTANAPLIPPLVQDGTVDGSDYAAVDNAATNFFGNSPEDINNDGIVDGSDLTIVDNNSTLFLGIQRP